MGHPSLNKSKEEFRMEVYGSDQFVGIVKNGKFQILIPESDCASVRLTGTREMEALTPEASEINLTPYENRALVVQGHHGSGDWIWAAHVIEQAGPALTAVVQEVAGQACITTIE